MLNRLATGLLMVCLLSAGFVESTVEIAVRMPLARVECRGAAHRLARIVRDTCRASEQVFPWHLLQMYQICLALQRCAPRATPCGVEWPAATKEAYAHALAGHRERRRALKRHFFSWA